MAFYIDLFLRKTNNFRRLNDASVLCSDKKHVKRDGKYEDQNKPKRSEMKKMEEVQQTLKAPRGKGNPAE